MELEALELKLKKNYDNASFISLVAYILSFIARKVDGYFWINYVVLAILILNLLFIFYNLYQIYKNKNSLQKISSYYLKNGIGLILTMLLTFLVTTLLLGY